jgi:F-type H+-transporting ATPase subunit gamma
MDRSPGARCRCCCCPPAHAAALARLISPPPSPSIKTNQPTVKQRIRAIKNIGKITKAMKMVAASKMRNAQVAVENSRGLVSPFVRLFGDHPAIAPPKQVAVAVTSDKGLCGGLNSSITKYSKVLFAMTPEDSKQTLVTIGDKGRSQLSRAAPEAITTAFQDTYKVRTTFSQASMIAEEVLAAEPDAIKVLYNKFHSAISFKPTVRRGWGWG